MNYIENIFVCLAAPLLIAILCMRGKGRRMMIFLLAGMTVCLLSSYISSFLAIVHGADLITASIELSPFVEELMKLFPVMFFLLVFEPEIKDTSDACLMTAIGFATFENVCFLMQNGAESLLRLAIRGLGTGVMHVVCAYIIAGGLIKLWDRAWLRMAGTVALLAVAITYHGIYNILVSQTGAVAFVGYFIPLFTAAFGLILRKAQSSIKK